MDLKISVETKMEATIKTKIINIKVPQEDIKGNILNARISKIAINRGQEGI